MRGGEQEGSADRVDLPLRSRARRAESMAGAHALFGGLLRQRSPVGSKGQDHLVRLGAHLDGLVQSPYPDWGVPGLLNNPRLELDDVGEGGGLEHFALLEPESDVEYVIAALNPPFRSEWTTNAQIRLYADTGDGEVIVGSRDLTLEEGDLCKVWTLTWDHINALPSLAAEEGCEYFDPTPR